MAPPAGSTPAAHHISLFTKGSDGTADFGLRYSPLTGGELQKPKQLPQGPYSMTDSSNVSYSVSLAQNDRSELKRYGTSAGRSTASQIDWNSQRFKNARLKESPQERFLQPVTESMELGWRQDCPLVPPSKGKTKCKETKIAEAQVLGPRYVDVISPTTKLYF